MLQHGGISPVDCVYMDHPRHTVYLQVLVGESANWAPLQFGDPISSSFGLVFHVLSPKAIRYLALQICPYNAIKFLPRQQGVTGNPRRVLKQPLGKNFVNNRKYTVHHTEGSKKALFVDIVLKNWLSQWRILYKVLMSVIKHAKLPQSWREGGG